MSTSYTTKRNDLFVFTVFSILILGAPLLLAVLSDSDALQAEQSFCPFKMLTGFPCPGCGITKSIVAIYEGSLSKSIAFHPFGLVAFVLAGMFLFARVFLKQTQVDQLYRDFFRNRRLSIALAVGIGVYHITRLYFFVNTHSIDEILKESIWR